MLPLRPSRKRLFGAVVVAGAAGVTAGGSGSPLAAANPNVPCVPAAPWVWAAFIGSPGMAAFGGPFPPFGGPFGGPLPAPLPFAGPFGGFFPAASISAK